MPTLTKFASPPDFIGNILAASSASAGRLKLSDVLKTTAGSKETLAEPGDGRVLVVDGGGSLRHALIGDQIAAGALAQGWAGVVIFWRMPGCRNPGDTGFRCPCAGCGTGKERQAG